MKRKETYSTSGVRIPVRFFGGWDFGAGLLKQKDWVKTAYAKGVPMGADLPAPTAKAPSFAVWAMKDPDSANLDRIQIVKGWSKNGQSFEKVYDVAWAGDAQARSGHRQGAADRLHGESQPRAPTRTPSARWS